MNKPRIIYYEKLIIAGASGNGNDTSAVWATFEQQSHAVPLQRKCSEDGYEIRLSNGVSRVHVGCAVENTQSQEPYVLFELPASHYAVFDIQVAKGYDSENAAIEAWLQSNKEGCQERLLPDSSHYCVEHYDERFCGNEPGSIVEIWIPVQQHCQLYHNHPFTKHGTCPCRIEEHVLAETMQIWNETKEAKPFVAELERRRIKGKKIWYDETQNTIFIIKVFACDSGGGCPENDTLIGRACHCPHYNHSKDFYPKHYCQCSAEYYRPMFEPIFGAGIELYPFKTVLSGDDECVIAVRIGRVEPDDA